MIYLISITIIVRGSETKIDNDKIDLKTNPIG